MLVQWNKATKEEVLAYSDYLYEAMYLMVYYKISTRIIHRHACWFASLSEEELICEDKDGHVYKFKLENIKAIDFLRY